MNPHRLARPLLALAAFLAMAPLPAFAHDPIDGSRPPPQTSGVSIPPGQIARAVKEIDSLAKEMMERSGVPGLAVVVVQDGKVLALKGYGVRKAGEPATVDADTVFQLASLSKAVGAGVVAHEVGKGLKGTGQAGKGQAGSGKVKWDTPVRTLLPWFALSDPWVSEHVTLADLYSHRSGLPDHAGDELESIGFDRRQVLERLRLLPLAPFRASYFYTNFGLTAAAEAVATAAGKEWADLSQEVLYKPLDMAATSSRFADFMARPNRAFPHVKTDGGFVSKFQRDPDAQAPAGGVSSSARDMGKWLAFVLGNGTFEGNEIVPAAALLPAMRGETISSPAYAVDARPGTYGFGFGVGVSPAGRVTLDHSGAFILGAATNFVLLPSEKLGIVVLTNAQPTGAPEALAMSFMDIVQFGGLTRDWYAAYQPLIMPMYKPTGALVGKAPPQKPEPAKPLANYTGTYGNAYFGDATVAEEAGGLVLIIGPLPRRYILAHWSGDSFTFRPEGEETFPPGTVSQVKFADGRMTVEIFNDNGLGTFARK
ncbi:serine hydrolase [Xanthobacter flavus]|uniref:serine hydrolase n=1 Tax=Xanthobacter flavus TaxID=281 RepID=UPI003728DC48